MWNLDIQVTISYQISQPLSHLRTSSYMGLQESDVVYYSLVRAKKKLCFAQMFNDTAICFMHSGCAFPLLHK